MIATKIQKFQSMPMRQRIDEFHWSVMAFVFAVLITLTISKIIPDGALHGLVYAVSYASLLALGFSLFRALRRSNAAVSASTDEEWLSAFAGLVGLIVVVFIWAIFALGIPLRLFIPDISFGGPFSILFNPELWFAHAVLVIALTTAALYPYLRRLAKKIRRPAR